MLAKPLTKPLHNPLTRLFDGFTTLASNWRARFRRQADILDTAMNSKWPTP